MTTDYTALDSKETSMNSFYPRSGWTATPEGAVDHDIPVADDVSLSGRFFPAAKNDPTVLFFYGNGETAVDYDNIGPLYNRIGANFFVADYRGYGSSGGRPTFSSMISDAHQVLDYVRSLLDQRLNFRPVVVMGRSMGRHAAFELATNRTGDLGGVIIESGRPTLGQFLHGLPDQVSERMEAEYQAKVASIKVPALVIHGQVDSLAPLDQAVSMFQSLASTQKQMIIVPGAGHNDLLYVGLAQYFNAIQEFIAATAA